MRLKHFCWMLFALLLTAVPVTAQDAPQVITAANIRQLQSVAHLDFDQLPEEAGTVDKGWFAVSTQGEYFATLNRKNSIVFWSLQKGYENTSTAICSDEADAGTLIDGSFHPEVDTSFIGVYVIGDTSYFGFHEFSSSIVIRFCGLDELPLRVWADDRQTWAETLPRDSTQQSQVIHFPLLYGLSSDAEWNTQYLQSGPENDTDSFLRIGRIDPPLAITVTQDGLFKRWNLETGDVTAQAQIGELPAAGQLNANGRYLAWADQEFEALHLLDFETGEDRVIAPLQGTYIPFILLSAEADVIIGVNVGLEPIVAAWDVNTGDRLDLGEYRACNRQPDMVRLSKDGTTLVIGCDTGLDIWRIR